MDWLDDYCGEPGIEFVKWQGHWNGTVFELREAIKAWVTIGPFMQK